VRDGWNLTGDTFVRDANGRLSFVARSDDMIVSSGYNIAGPDVEAALLSHPAVAECGVVRQAHHRALQISARDRIRHPTAEDRNRQVAAFCLAADRVERGRGMKSSEVREIDQ
jgi:acyl-coenzyme A synthetase/AMP-(fatty) acid ligase